jgi:hypothetical protein
MIRDTELENDQKVMEVKLGQAHDLAKSLFDVLGFLPDSWERTGAMGRAEECKAYIERLITKCQQ